MSYPHVSNTKHENRTCSTMCHTETWLADAVRDSHVNIDGFSLFRSDGNKDSDKQDWRRFVFVNEKWCHQNNLAVKRKVCTPTLRC